MSPWAFWLCAVLLILIGSALAVDVPFVFDEKSSDVASYTSAQLEQAHLSSHDLVGVPAISTQADSEILAFPVVGGGTNSEGTTEKNVTELKKLFDSRVEPENTKVHEEAIHIGISHPGDYTIEQVAAIFSYLMSGDGHKRGWSYVHDPRGANNFFFANQTLKQGEEVDPKRVGGGGCADFAILMSALVESIGGTTRIILTTNNTAGGHAYTEVYVGQLNSRSSQVNDTINWLKQEFETDKIFTNIDTDTRDVWLNLDWWPDEKGNPHPGGPFFTGEKNIVLFIRKNATKTQVPLNLPEKFNRPPRLISLTSDKSSPQEKGTAITWTTEAKDQDNDQILYRFFLNDDPVTGWTKDDKWIWTTIDGDIGENQIEVHVRDGKYGHALTNGFDSNKMASFTITASKTVPVTATKEANQLPVLTSLTSDKVSPQETGSVVTWTAKASDSENDPTLYRFFLNGQPVTDWQSQNQWTWTTTKDNVGEKQIEVRVRDGKHAGPDGFDSRKVASFEITESKSVSPENELPVSNGLEPILSRPQLKTSKVPKENLPEGFKLLAALPEMDSSVNMTDYIKGFYGSEDIGPANTSVGIYQWGKPGESYDAKITLIQLSDEEHARAAVSNFEKTYQDLLARGYTIFGNATINGHGALEIKDIRGDNSFRYLYLWNTGSIVALVDGNTNKTQTMELASATGL
ncbi:MAG: hypothetical protein NTU95_00455 [Methanothrix sp.]|nr:hypothetical protein [Methanothrix sp.]